MNCGFEMLRTHIPSAAKHKKMSKVDTLRHAVEYIQSLTRMLNRHSSEDEADRYSTTSTNIDEPPSLDNLVKCEEPVSPNPEPPVVSTPQTPIEAYESGYETSSYYSTHSMISPVPYQPPTMYNHNPTDFNHVSSTTSRHGHHGVTDANSIHSSVIQPIRTFNYYDTSNLGIEPNSEEDELLDAIANWQDSQ